jgi:hypothetical protein
MTKKRYDEIIENEWTSLRSLWEGCRASVKDDEIRQEIDALFKREGREGLSEARDWHDLNLAEQRVGAHLLPAQLDAEYQCLLDIARERKEMFLTGKGEALCKSDARSSRSTARGVSIATTKTAIEFYREAVPTATSP